jgi:hypothetical protein
VLVFHYEFVEVQSHPVPLFAQDILRTDSITKTGRRQTADRRPGRGVNL